MKIAIIGAGKVGSTLGRRWSQCGHTIAFGVRGPEDSKHQALHRYAEVSHSLEAVENAAVVVLAVQWPSARSAVALGCVARNRVGRRNGFFETLRDWRRLAALFCCLLLVSAERCTGASLRGRQRSVRCWLHGRSLVCFFLLVEHTRGNEYFYTYRSAHRF